MIGSFGSSFAPIIDSLDSNSPPFRNAKPNITEKAVKVAK